MTCDKYRLLLHELLDGQMPRRMMQEMAEHEAVCPVCVAYREEMYALLQNLHTLDADIEPPEELSIAWRQMIRMEKPAKRRVDTNMKVFIAVAALLAVMFGGTTLVHMGLLPGSVSMEDITDKGLFPPKNTAQTLDIEALSAGDGQFIKPAGDSQILLRKGVYTARTSTFDEDRDSILTLAEQYGGWSQYEAVSGEPLSQEGKGGRFCSLQVRVPENQLSGFLRSISSIIDISDSELVQQDYSEQYAETAAKLAGDQERLSRFKQLLAETTDIEEIMKIEAQISTYETQINAARATLENWDARKAFSQIDIALTETAVPTSAASDSLWGRMQAQFSVSMRAVSRYFMDMLVFMTMAAPWILIVVIMAGTALLIEKLHWRGRQY